MDIYLLLALIGLAAFTLKSRDQGRRINLLGSYLGKYDIEKRMANLTDGYLRALGESDPERQAQIWNLFNTAEIELSEQFNRFVAEFSKVDALQARVSKFAFAIPYADKLFPVATFDLRKALSIHAQGISQAASNRFNQSPQNKAFTMSAELFLMQHTCHWCCRSKTLASARMLARHQTAYAQVMDSVSPQTRQAYSDLIGS